MRQVNDNPRYQTAIYSGKASQAYTINTAINKQRVLGSIYLSELGLEGDECAHSEFHGGLERALHHYPREHYSFWQQKYDKQSQAFADFSSVEDVSVEGISALAGMGENISTLGMSEDNVHIGDRYQWGDAVIEVSQPRSPCMNLNKRWGIDDISVQMQQLSLCGWLYRVINPAMVSEKSQMQLIYRPDNSLSIKQVCDIYFGDPLNKEGINKLLSVKALSNSWRDKLEQRLVTGNVENWNFRLLGHA